MVTAPLLPTRALSPSGSGWSLHRRSAPGVCVGAEGALTRLTRRSCKRTPKPTLSAVTTLPRPQHHASHLMRRVSPTAVLDAAKTFEVHHGEHTLIEFGVATGCPLSPLMGARSSKPLLKTLDKTIPAGCASAGYMYDLGTLTRTRRAVRKLKVQRVANF
jgi:hypothetical protein